jgi:hypothetical protein
VQDGCISKQRGRCTRFRVRGPSDESACARAVREALAAATLAGGDVTYRAMTLGAGAAFTKDRTTYRPLLGVSPFGQGPSDMAAFAAIYEIFRNLTHMLLVGRYFGPQESSSYWAVYKFFASQSQHKYKITIFFFRRSK